MTVAKILFNFYLSVEFTSTPLLTRSSIIFAKSFSDALRSQHPATQCMTENESRCENFL